MALYWLGLPRPDQSLLFESTGRLRRKVEQLAFECVLFPSGIRDRLAQRPCRHQHFSLLMENYSLVWPPQIHWRPVIFWLILRIQEYAPAPLGALKEAQTMARIPIPILWLNHLTIHEDSYQRESRRASVVVPAWAQASPWSCPSRRWAREQIGPSIRRLGLSLRQGAYPGLQDHLIDSAWSMIGPTRHLKRQPPCGF